MRGPQNQTAVVGASVIFQCRIGGDPLPDVLWRRTASGGNMPLRKFVIFYIKTILLLLPLCLYLSAEQKKKKQTI